MCEARGALGDRVETQALVCAAGMRDADRDAAGAVGVTDDAFLRDVEVLAIAVEQGPARLRVGMRLSVSVQLVVGEFRLAGRTITACRSRRPA
jgi:hypothetical protein